MIRLLTRGLRWFYWGILRDTLIKGFIFSVVILVFRYLGWLPTK